MIIERFNQEKENQLLDFLEKEVGFENYGNAIERGLERIKPLFTKYIKAWEGKVITIAGTNGKGETVLYLKEFLSQTNKTFSVWMSPHVFSIKERIQDESDFIDYSEFDSLFSEIKKEESESGIKLSYYEFLFLAFIKRAFKRKSEYLILEVGLGGRLDAVNLFDAEIIGLTSIGRDHQKFLGNSLKKILHEKLGVIREQKIVFTAFESNYLRREAKRVAFDKFSFLLDLVEAQVIQENSLYSQKNKKMAEMIARELFGEITFNNVCLKRFEPLKINGGKVDFKNAHNPEGFRSMVSELCRADEKYDGILLGLSQRSIADLRSMLKSLLAYTCNNVKIYLSPFAGQKALSEASAKALSDEFSLNWVGDWKSFFYSEEIRNKNILVSGSNYFIGSVYQYHYQSSQ